MGGNVVECRVSLFFNASLSFIRPTNYDGRPTTVLKRSANRAIILAKVLSNAPRAG